MQHSGKRDARIGKGVAPARLGAPVFPDDGTLHGRPAYRLGASPTCRLKATLKVLVEP